MILSELLHVAVRDNSGHRLGMVIDARFVLDENTVADARLYGLVVSKRSGASFRGYERTGVESPWPIAQLLEWLHRDSFLVLWDDIEVVTEKAIRLRTGYSRHPSSLREETTS